MCEKRGRFSIIGGGVKEDFYYPREISTLLEFGFLHMILFISCIILVCMVRIDFFFVFVSIKISIPPW
jgi:hypothetical protein